VGGGGWRSALRVDDVIQALIEALPLVGSPEHTTVRPT
jgi:hypothetical protein